MAEQPQKDPKNLFLANDEPEEAVQSNPKSKVKPGTVNPLRQSPADSQAGRAEAPAPRSGTPVGQNPSQGGAPVPGGAANSSTRGGFPAWTPAPQKPEPAPTTPPKGVDVDGVGPRLGTDPRMDQVGNSGGANTPMKKNDPKVPESPEVAKAGAPVAGADQATQATPQHAPGEFDPSAINKPLTDLPQESESPFDPEEQNDDDQDDQNKNRDLDRPDKEGEPEGKSPAETPEGGAGAGVEGGAAEGGATAAEGGAMAAEGAEAAAVAGEAATAAATAAETAAVAAEAAAATAAATEGTAVAVATSEVWVPVVVVVFLLFLLGLLLFIVIAGMSGSGKSSGSSGDVSTGDASTIADISDMKFEKAACTSGSAAGGCYQLPDSKYYSPYGSNHTGTKCLVQMIAATSKAWKEKYPNDVVRVGDMNAPGHLSHKTGVDVDIYTDQAANMTIPSYSKERSIEYGRLWFSTGNIDYIFFNDASVRSGVQDYAKANKLPGVIQAWPNHEDHFHVRLKVKDDGSCAGTPK